MNITIKQLKVVIEVAKRGSMIRAAAALHLTPPAISIQIKEIEKEVGLLLFNRTKKNVSLSSAGENFVVHARRVLGCLREAENDITRLKGLDRGLVTIGMVSRGAYFLPKLLANFHRQHPGIDVKLRVVHGRRQLMEMIEAAEVDLLVMSEPSKDFAARSEPFAANPLVFVCPPDDPFLEPGPVPIAALAEASFIVREQGSRMRMAMEAFFSKHRCAPRITMEIPSSETIKHAVMAGMGLTFLPLHTVGSELRNGSLAVLDVRGTPVTDVWTLVHLPSRVLSPAAEAFRQLVIQQGQKELRRDNSKLLSLAFKRRYKSLLHP